MWRERAVVRRLTIALSPKSRTPYPLPRGHPACCDGRGGMRRGATQSEPDLGRKATPRKKSAALA